MPPRKMKGKEGEEEKEESGEKAVGRPERKCLTI